MSRLASRESSPKGTGIKDIGSSPRRKTRMLSIAPMEVFDVGPSNEGIQEPVEGDETVTRIRLECYVCNKTFANKSSFQRHTFIHDNQRQFSCEFCGIGFNSGSTLIGHRRRHIGERPYKCRFCDRTFIETSNRTTHERTHTGEKPYKCEICDRSFSVSCSLVRHRRIHTNEAPYVCSVCSKRYRQYNGLRNHMERYHKEMGKAEIRICGSKVPKRQKPKKEESHTCNVCGESFQQYYDFLNHRNVYTRSNSMKPKIMSEAHDGQNPMFPDTAARHNGTKCFVNEGHCIGQGFKQSQANSVSACTSSLAPPSMDDLHSNATMATKKESDVDQFLAVRNVMF